MPPSRGIAVQTLEVVGAQVLVDDAVAEHVVDRGEQGVGDRDNRTLGPAPSGQPVVEGVVVGALLPAGRPGGFHQGGLEPTIALACGPRAALAGRLMVTGADLGPRAD